MYHTLKDFAFSPKTKFHWKSYIYIGIDTHNTYTYSICSFTPEMVLTARARSAEARSHGIHPGFQGGDEGPSTAICCFQARWKGAESVVEQLGLEAVHLGDVGVASSSLSCCTVA